MPEGKKPENPREKKAPGLTPHPKASPAPSNKASNVKLEHIRNYPVLQE
jgi:hypothetical protein